MANDLIRSIVDYKKQWQDATAAGNKTAADKAAEDAAAVYEKMRNAGLYDVADKLQASDYGAAVKYQDAYGTEGKVTPREFMPTMLGKLGYQYNPDDFTYNEGNDNVFFKGIPLGKADYMSSEGRSYFTPEQLREKSKEIADALGWSATDKTAYGVNRDKMYDEYFDALNIAKNTNPYETEIGKSIMQGYGIEGDKAKRDVTASAAAGSGGNIDTFTIANRKRQDLEYKNAGEQAVLADHNSRIANITNILNSLGYNVNQTFANSETALNNQVARDSQKVQNDLAIAETFGGATGNQFTNQYMGKDMDFKAAIDQAEESGMSADTINKLKEARFMKQVAMNDFSGGVLDFKPTSEETANMYLGDKQLDINKELGMMRAARASRGRVSGVKPTLTAAQAQTAYNNGVKTPQVLEAMEYYYGLSEEDDNTKGDITEDISNVYGSAKTKQKKFMDLFLNNKDYIHEAELKDLVLEHSKAYDLEMDFIQNLFNAYGFSAAWLHDYKNSGWFGGKWGSGIKGK